MTNNNSSLLIERILSTLPQNEDKLIEFDSWFSKSNMEYKLFCEGIAIEAAKRTVADINSFKDNDWIMNSLFVFMLKNNEYGLVKLAYDVFLAFDDGEYSRKTDSNSVNPVIKYTIPQLEKIIAENSSK